MTNQYKTITSSAKTERQARPYSVTALYISTRQRSERPENFAFYKTSETDGNLYIAEYGGIFGSWSKDIRSAAANARGVYNATIGGKQGFCKVVWQRIFSGKKQNKK